MRELNVCSRLGNLGWFSRIGPSLWTSNSGLSKSFTKNDAMGIAHRNASGFIVPRKRDGQGHVDNITSETQGPGSSRASNVACSHFHRYRRSFAQHQGAVGLALCRPPGFDLEEGFFGVAVLEKEFAEDTQAVTAFFRLAAVGIVDPKFGPRQEEDFPGPGYRRSRRRCLRFADAHDVLGREFGRKGKRDP